MTRRLVFLGPTHPEMARQPRLGEVEIHPPIAALDLLRMGLAAGDVVGIVDGYFHQARAVPHKELLRVLSDGVHVLGASSIGALRAAELQPWGMHGVGAIYADYYSQRLIADDEVALLHAEADQGYAKLSEPLVNIRATLQGAVAANVCRHRTADQLVSAFASTPYPMRQWSALARHAHRLGLPHSVVCALTSYCRDHVIDQKRLDAQELLREVARYDAGSAEPRTVVNRTVYLYRWELATSRVQQREALQLLQTLHPQFPQWYAAVILNRMRSDCQRICGVTNTDAVQHGAHLGLYSTLNRSAHEFLEHWTTAEERRQLDQNSLLRQFLVRSLRVKPGIAPLEYALRALSGHPAFDMAGSLLTQAHRTNTTAVELRSDFDPRRISAEQVSRWLAATWHVASDDPHDLELAAWSRGFTSVGDAVRAAQPFQLWAMSYPSQVRPMPPLH